MQTDIRHTSDKMQNILQLALCKCGEVKLFKPFVVMMHSRVSVQCISSSRPIEITTQVRTWIFILGLLKRLGHGSLLMSYQHDPL